MPGHRLIIRPMSNREGHSPLAIHTAEFVHVLVLLAAGSLFALGRVLTRLDLEYRSFFSILAVFEVLSESASTFYKRL